MTRTGLLALIAIVLGAATTVTAQTAGDWGISADQIVLTAADNSTVTTFRCDSTAGALFVTLSANGAAGQADRVTVRANNGTAYSVPLSDRSGVLGGAVPMVHLAQAGRGAATTLVVTFPPSQSPTVIVDVVPAFADLVAGCPTL
jgi:hypothetical protein